MSVTITDAVLNLGPTLHKGMAPKVRIEETLSSGEKLTIVLEGQRVTKTRVLQVLDMLSLMGGGREENAEGCKSVKEQIWEVLVERFSDGSWFSLKEAHTAAREVDPNIKIAIISSYLSKFMNEGRVVKRGQKPSTLYRVCSTVAKTMV